MGMFGEWITIANPRTFRTISDQMGAPNCNSYCSFCSLSLGMYSLTPLMMSLASATLFNLSLLTSDAYAIIAGVVLFSQVPSFLYFIALVIIVSGLIMYNHGSESPEEYRKLTGTLQQSYQQQELKKLEEEKPIIH